MDSTFWALIGLILFLVLVAYLSGFRRISKALDDRALRIQSELEEARELKEEAKQQLAEFQRRRGEAEDEAKEIVAAARREADLIRTESQRKNDEFMKRRMQAAEQRIGQAERDAVAEVKARAIDIAIAASADLIAQRNSGNQGRQYVDQSIEAVRRNLN